MRQLAGGVGTLFAGLLALTTATSAITWWMVRSSDLDALVDPAAGVALVAAVSLPARRWPIVAAAVLLGHAATTALLGQDIDGWTALGFVVADVIEPFVAAAIIAAVLRRSPRVPSRLDLADLRDLSALGLGGVVIAPAVSAAIAAAAAASWNQDADVSDVALHWWLGHALGVVVIAPLCFSWTSARGPRRWSGTAALGVVAASTAGAALVLALSDLPVLFLVLIGLVVVGATFDVRTVASAAAGVTVATGVVAATDPGGLIDGLDPSTALWVTQVELLFFIAVAYVVAAEVHARAMAAERSLRQTATVSELRRLLLPPASLEGPGFRAVGVYDAAERDIGVGGDWYLIRRLADDRIVLGVGDIVGHDVEAARTMASVRSGLLLETALDPTPHRLLERLDAFAEVEPSIRCGSAWLGTFDPGTRTLIYASAGHLPPLLVIEGRVAPLDGANTAVIGLPQGPRRSASVTLPVGAELALYTDGLVEHRDSDVDAGIARLATALVARHRDPRAVVDEVRSGSPADDDALLVLVGFVDDPLSHPSETRA